MFFIDFALQVLADRQPGYKHNPVYTQHSILSLQIFQRCIPVLLSAPPMHNRRRILYVSSTQGMRLPDLEKGHDLYNLYNH